MEDLIKKITSVSQALSASSGIIDGKVVPKNVRSQTILVTDHNRFTVSDGGTAGTSAAGTFTINPTASPKTADSV